MKRVLLFSVLGTALNLSAQTTVNSINETDTVPLKHKYLQEVTIVGRASKSDYHQMPEVVGTNIYSGKKNALIVLDNVQCNVVTNNMRQLMIDQSQTARGSVR